jgi:hypothetical protein
MGTPTRITLAAVAVLAIAAAISFSQTVPSSTAVVATTSPTSPDVAPPTRSTVIASPFLATAAPIDTTGWTPYVSERYGLELAYPPGWAAIPSNHDWTWDRDSTNFLSTGQESFFAPGTAVRVSAWTVPLAEDLDQTWSVHEAWAADYCARSNDSPCTGIHDRVIPVCIEHRDCHAAVIVPFADDVIFFGHGGVLPSGMTIVAVWWGEDSPAVAPYGGSTRLLEAFLSTMGVFPPYYPESQQAAADFLKSKP